MTQQGPTAAMEEKLSCPICFEFFQDPVSLKCQHSFCRSCLETPTRIQQKQRKCPVCRGRNSIDNIQPAMSNMKLRNIVEAYLQREEKKGSGGRAVGLVVCARHNKKLRFFCEECEELVCAVCVETERHAKHKHQPVKEEAQWRKREITSLIYNLPEKLELDIKQARATRKCAAQYIKTQAQTTAGQIKSEFANLHQFLRVEEEARLAALKQEEGMKTGLLTERIARLASNMTSLPGRISDIQTKMKTDDISFLQVTLYFITEAVSIKDIILY
ncbi:unnamed protein product [Oncorhynchus mykiss]|uniref:Uncharacterized protein n=1 Tax=Oncorhynchus mykiss TaxID=8022 RepID=A0A060X9B2_ONCMY|nr:unnamed protein product [Oncorhynchus mykiss]